MKTKALKRISIFLTIVLLAVGTFSFTSNSEKYFLIAKNLDIFATLFKEVNTYYVDEVDPTDLMETGITAMLKSLDPYTNYISEDRIEDYRFMTTGQYGGIGALIGKRDDDIMILSPYDDWPADKGGLIISDIITKVDGTSIKGKNTKEVSELLKGQAGTKLIVTIKRHNKKEEFDVELTREKIQINNVPYYGMVNDEVGYLELTGFTQKASREVKEALEKLKEMGAKKVIFDLRGNSGGLLNEAVNVSNIFIEKGNEVVSTKGKVQEWNKTYKTLNTPTDLDIPIVILTGGSTASAAEIVSGVLQDYDRGVLLGSTTFGKGLVQATRPLTYNSQLKVTTAKYYIPSGRCIQAIDYSKKENGKAKKLADSVRTAFKTMGGRTVYDGAGLKPDVDVDKKDVPQVLITLSRKNLSFDFATEYYFKHESIAPAKEFKLTDQEYDEFLAWLEDKELDYETRVEKKITELTETAEKEDVAETIKEELELLQAKVSKNKEEDLTTYKTDIKEMLEAEIISRYYGQKGSIEASFDNDEDITNAMKILQDEAEYKKILTAYTE